MSDHAKDLFVAPNMSQFTEAQIDDLSSHDPEQEHWVANYILNSMFGSGMAPQASRQYVFHLLRRCEAAFRAHSDARGYTLQYLDNGDALTAYLAGVLHWESFLMHSYIAFTQLQQLAGGAKLFNKGDGSTLARLNLLYNTSKHANESQYPQDGTLSIWLENAGLRSTEAHLGFTEISNDLLPELASWASLFSNPATAEQELRQRIASKQQAAEI